MDVEAPAEEIGAPVAKVAAKAAVADWVDAVAAGDERQGVEVSDCQLVDLLVVELWERVELVAGVFVGPYPEHPVDIRTSDAELVEGPLHCELRHLDLDNIPELLQVDSLVLHRLQAEVLSVSRPDALGLLKLLLDKLRLELRVAGFKFHYLGQHLVSR